MPSDPEKRASVIGIDGVFTSERVSPASAQESAEFLAEAAALGRAVAPLGGGTAIAMGNLPERVDVVLATERLAGILDYEPTDLVLSVGAGSRLGDVQAVLGEHGQRLPINPPGGAEATIGGLIATGLWGPLRHNSGTLRDLLIGIEVAHPSGTVSKAGGMVVKNVSGYDMPRLYLGSLGSLGLVTSANFKVLPRPRAEATVIAEFESAEGTFAAASRIRSSGDPVASLEVAWGERTWLLAARIEGRDSAVSQVVGRVAAMIGSDIVRFDGPESADWWLRYVDDQHLDEQADTVLVRCGVRPRDTATLAMGIVAAMPALNVDVQSLWASPGIGAVVARLQLSGNGSAELLAEAQSVLFALADTTTILSAPAPWKRGIDVWGREPEGFEVMRSLREQFDPVRTINPGRFAGFL